MPSSYPYRLQQMELTPPEGSWERISVSLDQEFPAGEGTVAEKVFHAELAPPAMAWDQIAATLEEAPAKEKTPVIRMRPLRWAAAAVVAGLLLGAWWYFSVPTTENTLATENNKPASPKTNTPAPKQLVNPVKTAVLVAGKKAPALPAERQTPLPAELRESVNVTEEPSEELLAALDETKAQVVHLTEEPRVSAPLIRDKKGKVIMDMSLLSGNAGSYISVTGPNGEPTRISSKFANYLIYLNKEESKEEYLDFLIRNSSVWKKRFDEWRNRIMNRQSFMPGTSNFFDILELQELIRENQ